MGILIAGVRVIDPPGYDNKGVPVFVNASGQKVLRPGAGDRWALWGRPMAEIANKPWFVGQVLSGPICLISARWSMKVAQPGDAKLAVPPSHGRIYEIGTLYTAVAGMLNLLAMIDASHRASQGARG